MSSIRLARPRQISSDHALSDEQIAHVAPAVYAKNPYMGMSERYAFVPTCDVLTPLRDAGFQVYSAAQQRPLKTDKDPYAKHMLRLRIPTAPRLGDGVPELVLVNAHDGTAKYHLMAGYNRFICTNGMVAGNTLVHHEVRHTFADVTKHAVLTGGMDIAMRQFQELIERIKRMQEVPLTEEQQRLLAARALELRYPGTVPPMDAHHLLGIRRFEDQKNDAWTVLNRIQENVIRGGMEVRSAMFGRRSTVRPVERVSANLRINQGLWEKAEELVSAA